MRTNFFSSSIIFRFRYFANFSADDRKPLLADARSEASAYAITPVWRFVTVKDAEAEPRKSPSRNFLAQPCALLVRRAFYLKICLRTVSDHSKRDALLAESGSHIGLKTFNRLGRVSLLNGAM